MRLSTPTQPTPTADGIGLGALLRRNWLILLLGLVLGATAGALITKVQQRQYTASASVRVTATGVQDSTSLANSRTSGTINLDTEAQLAKSTAVAQRVRSLDPARASSSTTDLTKHLSISVPANTEVLALTYTADSATGAEQLANDFARAYLDERQRAAQATLDAQLAKVRANLSALNSSLQAVSAQLATLPANSKQRNYASAQRALLISEITALNAQSNQLSGTVITPGLQLTQATVPSSPSSPSLVLNVAAGAACGLLLGLLVAWLRFAHVRQVRRPEDVARRMHVSLVGSVSSVRQSTIEPVGSPQFAEYQRIVNRIRAVLGEGGSILVTGATPAAPTSTVAANIAATLTRFNGSVGIMVIDADAPAFTTLPDKVQLLVRDGSADVSGDISREALRPAGYLVVAAPDPVSCPEAQSVAGVSDAVLVVMNARTKVRDGRAAIDQLDAVGAPLLGAVLVLRSEAAEAGRRMTAGDAASAQVDEASTADVASEGSGAVEPDKVNDVVVPSHIRLDGGQGATAPPEGDRTFPYSSASARAQAETRID